LLNIKIISIMRRILLFLLILETSFCFAQIGSLSPEILTKLKQSYAKDPRSKAATNAISNNIINDLSLNRSNVGKTDHFFKYKVSIKGISDQKSSGRCWMFTGLNVIRPKVIDKYKLAGFEFSQNYLFFWDQLEKANLFLEIMIQYAAKSLDDKTVDWAFKTPIGDGGVWNSLTNLIDKYGLVPKDVMRETKNSNNTRYLNDILATKLREDGLELRSLFDKKTDAKKIQDRKVEMLQDIYKILAYNLGEPPTEFTWRFEDKDNKLSETKTYTPMSFYKEMLTIQFDDYVMLMNDPSRAYYKLYEIEFDRNVMEGKNWKFINLPVEELKQYAKESIKNNEALYFSCDVGKQLNSEEGLLSVDNYDYESLYGIKFGMDKKQRIITYESGSTHGMALVGVDVDTNEKPIKWMIENSWGATSGHNGYLTATDEWFNEYMFRLVVLKKYVDQKTLEILKQTPIKLPPWDPMFSFDN